MLFGEPSPRPGDSPTIEPRRLSALRVLEQWPVPVVAVTDDGAVVFANTAFAHLVCSCDAVASMSYDDICSALPADETFFAVTRLGPKDCGSQVHSDQATVFVKMRKSATHRAVNLDEVTMFEELVKHLAG
jgi:hypothetical protein